nr:DUF1616 domain-containing protein [Candidatus Baldrarchaeota archaeon]
MGRNIAHVFAVMILIFMMLFQFISVIALSSPRGLLREENVNKVDVTVDDARRKVYDAYAAVVDAEASGGNVTDLVNRLNEAIELIRLAENTSDSEEASVFVEQAVSIADDVLSEIGEVKEEGLALRRFHLFLSVFSISLLVVSGVLIYFYGPKVFWGLWVRIKGNWKVKSSGSKRSRRGWLVDEEVFAVVLAILVIVCVFAMSQMFYAGRVVEPFSQLAVLGPDKKLGGYPSEVHVGEKFKLYMYVRNYMGRVMYYIVYIKLGNRSVPLNLTYPYPAPVIARFERILMHNESWIFPIYLVMNETGINYRIVFELWIYNETIASEQFHQRTCQLWLNVTEW